jgi:hypothetical protein
LSKPSASGSTDAEPGSRPSPAPAGSSPASPTTGTDCASTIEDGRVEIDSNAVENTIRPIALGRKNALFAGHDEGGRAWGRIASLIETAKMNGVEPFTYLNATLEALAHGHPQSRLDERLPWAFNSKSS